MSLYVMIDGSRVRVPNEVRAEGPEAIDAWYAEKSKVFVEKPKKARAKAKEE